MTTAVAKLQPVQQQATVQDQSPLLVPQMFDAMWRLADAMSRAKTVPEHLRGSPGDCLRVVEIAHRCGQSPFALADHIFFTSGRMAMDGQAMAGLVNASPKIEGNLAYRYEGDARDPATHLCTVSGRLQGESEVRKVTVTLAQGIGDSRGAKARWQSDPEQMLAYYGARKWARRHAPEVTMGLYTPDELRAGAEGGSVLDVTLHGEVVDQKDNVEGAHASDLGRYPASEARMTAAEDFWSRESLAIPPTKLGWKEGSNWQQWQERMIRGVRAAPDALALIKFQRDNLAALDQLNIELPRAYEAIERAILDRSAELPALDEPPFGDQGSDNA